MKKIHIMGTTLVASAGMLFTACSSMHHEHKHASYETGGAYSSADQSSFNESSGSQQNYETSQNNTSQNYASSQSGQSENNIVIPLHEEQLNVGKRTVDAGQVTIRKIVTTETVNQPVELRHETVVIDRQNAGSGQQMSSNASSSQSNLSQNSGSQNSSANYNSSTTAQSNSGWQPSAQLMERANTGYPSSNQQAGSPRAVEQQQERAGIEQNEASGAATQSSSADYSSSSQSASASGSANLNSSANINQSSQSQNSQATQVGTPFQEQTFTIRLQEEQPVINKSVVQTGEVTARKNTQMQQENISQQLRREQVQVDKNGVAAQNVQINGNLNTAGATVNESAGAELNKTNQNQNATQQNDSQSDQQKQQDQK